MDKETKTKKTTKVASKEEIYILPLRNSVIFPKLVLPILATRESSFSLMEKAFNEKVNIGILTQKVASIDDPMPEDLYEIGVSAKVVKLEQEVDYLQKGAQIEGNRRFRIKRFTETKPFLKAEIEYLKDINPNKNDTEFVAIHDNIRQVIDQIMDVSRELSYQFESEMQKVKTPEQYINYVATALEFDVKKKLDILQTDDLKLRATLLLAQIMILLQRYRVRNQIDQKVNHNLSKSQKEFFLQEQMKEIQKELGRDPATKEIDELKEKSKKKLWNKKVAELFEKEIKRLTQINQMSPEYGVQLAYLNTLLELPWEEKTKDDYDLQKAQKVLDKDHFGLEKVKERILEYLAVLKLKGDLKSPILCLVGPPGVGKTSLGKSIAEALNRKFVRMSLGGLHDEAEIRGHRRTYIGAMPGRIIQNLRRVKSSNPVFVLDEIDKIGADFKGDPASALLEVLDPEQNNTFFDNYVEIEYDLSNVMFIATANTTSTIHPALLDRMEIIDMTGYLIEEKVEIAKRHLLPKQLTAHGIEAKQCKIKESVLKFIIENYTRESGVRELDKCLASVARKRAKEVASNISFETQIDENKIIYFFGSPKFIKSSYEDFNIAGIATGMAWTPVGGEILTLEASASRGNGKLTLTGNLGKVMTESATIAYEYVKAHYSDLKIQPLVFRFWDIHVHAPEGAIPKDGPSAGITITCALASLFTQRKLKPYIAMTGEITLTGRVLPVGGIKEKILAARRAGIKQVILPDKNKNDVDDIKSSYLEGMQIIYVKTIDEVLNLVLSENKIINSKKISIPKRKNDIKSNN